MTTARDIDGGWAWLVLVASYVNMLLISGLAIVSGMFQVVFLENFQGSVAFTSWVTALFSSLMQLAGPFSSALANCTNCRVATMVGGICLAIGLTISGFADSLEFLFVSFGLVAGIGLGLAYSASIVVINYFFDKRRSMVTGVALSASGIGMIIAPQVSTYLNQNLSWRESLVVLGAAAGQICLTGALMFPIHERKNQQYASIGGKLCTSVCRCLPFVSKDDSEKPRATQEMVQLGTDIEIVVEEVEVEEQILAKDEYERNREVGNLHYDHIEGKMSVAAAEPLLSNNQKDFAISDQDVHEIRPQLQSSLTSNGASHHLSDSGHLQEIPEDKTIFTNKDMQCVRERHGNDLQTRKESGTKLAGSSVSLDKTSKKKISQLSNRHASQTQSHFELHRHPYLLKLRSGHSQSSHDNLHLRPLPFTLRNHGVKQNPMLHVGLSHNMLSQSHMKGSHDSLSQRVVIVARNQSLISLVPSCNLEIIDVRTSDCDQHSLRVRSNTSLHSNNLSLKHGLEKTAASFKSSFMSVTSVPLPQTNYGKPQSLWCSGPFWVLCMQLFLANTACGIYNIHMPSFVKSKGFSEQEMTNIMSVNGFACFFGRITVGMLANAVGFDFLLYWALHILGGTVLLLMPVLTTNFPVLVMLVLMVGTYYGSVYSVLTTITIQYVGLANLATAFGIEMISAGLGFLVAPPCIGVLVDMTGSYDASMYCGGALMILSSLVLMLMPVLKPEVTRETDQNVDVSEGDDNDDDNADDEENSKHTKEASSNTQGVEHKKKEEETDNSMETAAETDADITLDRVLTIF